MIPRLLLVLSLAAVAAAEKPAPPAPLDRAAAEAALAKGIAWLKSQAQDGKWMLTHDGKSFPEPSLTALALTPVAQSMTAEERANSELLKKAQAFLLQAQREDGGIQNQNAKYDNYYTSATLMALAAVGDPATKSARDKMRDFLLTLQRAEEGRVQGGFGYNTQKSADLSNAQFAIESLRTAGIPEDHPAMVRAKAFLARAQNRSENPENEGAKYEVDGKTVVPGNDGSAGYEPGVSKAGLKKLPDGTFVARGYGSMTYALLKCYLLVGLPADDPRVAAAVEWLSENYGWDENPGFQDIAKELNHPDAPYWGLYYYYFTAAKALRLLGQDTLQTPDGPRNWRADLAAALAERQQDDGRWVNDQSKRWEEANPLITTAYACIALQEILASPR